jgi:toxin-antitoxin system PIN domain toxin
VILLDANLLIYAHVASFPQHPASRAWLDAQLGGTTAVGFPWPSLLSFLRIVTNPRVFELPEPISQAWQQVAEWLGCENAWIPQPGDRHGEILAGLLADPSVRANLVHDAHIAALAIEHGLQLCSTDGDFARFAGLRWSNPLRS